MNKFSMGFLVCAVTAMRLHGVDQLPRLAMLMRAVAASQTLRACYPRQWKISSGDISTIKRDIVDDCIAGKPEAYDSMDLFIATKKHAALQAAIEAQRLAAHNKTAEMEHEVKLLLAPDKHPCHNLTNMSGVPSSGYAFAKNWVQSGSLHAAIEAKYQTLFDALAVFKPTSIDTTHKK